MKQFYRVVGVIPQLRAKGLDQPGIEGVFLAEPMRGPVWTVKVTSGDPVLLLPAIRKILHDLAPRAPLIDARLMTDVIARSTARTSFIMTLLLLAALAALLLSAVGIYGVISYLVTQRRTEIGVRVALGARAPQVAALVLGQTMRLTFVGITVGLAGAFAGTRLLKSLLFDVSPTDPLVLAATSAVLILIAVAASLVPTRRASRIDPVEAMRSL